MGRATKISSEISFKEVELSEKINIEIKN